MPLIDTRVTVKMTAPQKEEIKTELGRLITTLNKPETYLMVGIEDSCDLWFGGKKLDKGAYVAVSLLGDAPKASYEKLTGQICDLLSDKLGIPGNAVYVTYHPVSDWGRSLFACFPAPQGVHGLDAGAGADGVDRMVAGTGH